MNPGIKRVRRLNALGIHTFLHFTLLLGHLNLVAFSWSSSYVYHDFFYQASEKQGKLFVSKGNTGHEQTIYTGSH